MSKRTLKKPDDAKTPADFRYEGALLVFEWLKVVKATSFPTLPEDLISGLKCDLEHSALIHWLCAGNEPLEEPPPVRFSRPDHQVVLDGIFQPLDVWDFSDPNGASALIVDQATWKILEKLGPTEWVATYKIKEANGETLWSSSRWRIQRSGPSNNPVFKWNWEAKRLPPTVGDDQPEGINQSG